MQTRTRTQLESGKIGAGCLITVVVVIAVLAGGGYWAFKAGTGMLAEQTKVAVRDNPVILEHIGNIEDITLDLKATAAAGEEEFMVFQLKGSKGSGELKVNIKQVSDEAVAISQGTLRMEDGKTYELVPGGAPTPPKPEKTD
jgi:hypothetical protein